MLVRRKPNDRAVALDEAIWVTAPDDRVTPPAGLTTVADVQSAMDSMGVPLKVTQPPLGQAVSFP